MRYDVFPQGTNMRSTYCNPSSFRFNSMPASVAELSKPTGILDVTKNLDRFTN